MSESVAKAFADVVQFAAPEGTSAEAVAEVVTPEVVAANAGRIYDWMTEQGWDQDSWSRELLFTYASLALGVDYEVFYDAWLAEKPAVVPTA